MMQGKSPKTTAKRRRVRSDDESSTDSSISSDASDEVEEEERAAPPRSLRCAVGVRWPTQRWRRERCVASSLCVLLLLLAGALTQGPWDAGGVRRTRRGSWHQRRQHHTRLQVRLQEESGAARGQNGVGRRGHARQAAPQDQPARHPRRGCARRGQVRPGVHASAWHWRLGVWQTGALIIPTARHVSAQQARTRASVAAQVPVQGQGPRGVQLPRHARAGGGAGRPHGGAGPRAVQATVRLVCTATRLGAAQKRRAHCAALQMPARVQALKHAHQQVHGRELCAARGQVAGPGAGHLGQRPDQADGSGLQCHRGAGGRARQRRGVRPGRQVRATRRCAEACVPQARCVAHLGRGLTHPCAQVHHQGALGPLQQPGACARSGASHGGGLAVGLRTHRPCTAWSVCTRCACAGRALAVEVLGQAKVAQLEELVRSSTQV